MKRFLLSVLCLCLLTVPVMAQVGEDPGGEPGGEDPICRPYMYVHLQCHPSQGYFMVELDWGGYCSGPPYITYGIYVMDVEFWEIYISPGTVWNHGKFEWVEYELSPGWSKVKVIANIECACGNSDSDTEIKNYRDAPSPLNMRLFLWRYKLFK